MARIADAEIERLKEEVDLAELVTRSGVALKQAGADLVGCCPFHEDDTPSLVVTSAKGLWHCMGACQRGGSVIDWVMTAEGVSFRHAVELLRAGEAPVVSGARRATARRLPAPVDVDATDADALAQVVEYYHATLLASPEAQAYLAARKLCANGVPERFRLGYANRTLGLRLANKQTKAGAAIRGQLARLGVYRQSGHEHLAGSLVVPVLAAATGVGAVIEAAGIASAVAAGATVAEASAGAIAFGTTAAVAGGLAAGLDNGQCEAGNTAACLGRDLGIVGVLTGTIATLGSGGLAAGVWGLETLPDAVFQGLGAFSPIFGIASSVFDITTTAAGAATRCG